MDPNLRSIKDAICENLRIITNTQGSDNLRAAEEQLSMLETKEGKFEILAFSYWDSYDEN